MHAHDRLYLQYCPDDDALQQLLSWQASAQDVNPQARAIQRDGMHLTLLHFGILADVFRELQQQQPALTKEIFLESVDQFITYAETLLPSSTTVQAEGLELFGSRSSVLALRVAVSDELMRAHARARQLLVQCLEACGISPAQMFMRGSPNFRFALELQPHISLLKAARRVPKIDITEQASDLHLEAMPIRYR